MFNNSRPSGLFSYESHNYPDGTRKEVRWSIGLGTIMALMAALAFAEHIPVDRIFALVARWALLAK